MNKFARLLAFAMLALAMMGCATTPSNLPMVDVSKMPDKALTAAEIDSVVRGKQMVGDIIRATGTKIPDVIYSFSADGTLKGVWFSWGGDVGKWHIDSSGELCTVWVREMASCGKPSVRGGKLLLQNPRTGGQFSQR